MLSHNPRKLRVWALACGVRSPPSPLSPPHTLTVMACARAPRMPADDGGGVGHHRRRFPRPGAKEDGSCVPSSLPPPARPACVCVCVCAEGIRDQIVIDGPNAEGNVPLCALCELSLERAPVWAYGDARA